MPFYFLLSAFLFGTIIGSFLTAGIYRLRSGERGFASGRSLCPKCKHKLGILDLIPLLSYLFLRGKCRYCRKKISPSYFWIELTTALAFTGIVWNFGVTNLDALAFYFFFTAILIFLAAYDWLTGEIPDRISLPALALALGGAHFIFTPTLVNSLLGLLVGGGFFFLLVVISNGKWMGGGDIRLGALLGVLLGFPAILLTIFLASLIGTIAGLILIGIQKSKNRKTKNLNLKSSIPFAPALTLGYYCVLIFGDQIWSWYWANSLNM